MTEQKIYPINPIFETTTRDGRKAWVAFYKAGVTYPWLGAIADGGTDCWNLSGTYDSGCDENLDLTTIPEIPPKAREPKPGEVWETTGGRPAMVANNINNNIHVWSRTNGKLTCDASALVRPWSADKPHGFEELIEAILQAYGNKE